MAWASKSRATPAAIANANAASRSAACDAARERACRPQALAVAANPVNRMAAQAMMDSLGYAGDAGPNGAAVLAAFGRRLAEGGGYAVVLMDLWMPVMDGLEAARRIPALDAASLIVAVTGHADAGMAACIRAGLDAALAKPLALDRLREALTSRAAGADLAAPRRVASERAQSRTRTEAHCGRAALAPRPPVAPGGWIDVYVNVTYLRIMTHSTDPLTITQMCDRFDVTPRTLRFYETKGLLAPKREGQRRLYGPRDRARLTLILRGKRFGFSLSEISSLLDLYDVGDGQRTQLAETLKSARTRLSAMIAQRDELTEAIADLESQIDEVSAMLARQDMPRSA